MTTTIRTRNRILVLALTAALMLCACLPSAMAVSGDDMLLVTIDNCTAGQDT